MLALNTQTCPWPLVPASLIGWHSGEFPVCRREVAARGAVCHRGRRKHDAALSDQSAAVLVLPAARAIAIPERPEFDQYADIFPDLCDHRGAISNHLEKRTSPGPGPLVVNQPGGQPRTGAEARGWSVEIELFGTHRWHAGLPGTGTAQFDVVFWQHPPGAGQLGPLGGDCNRT